MGQRAGQERLQRQGGRPQHLHGVVSQVGAHVAHHGQQVRHCLIEVDAYATKLGVTEQLSLNSKVRRSCDRVTAPPFQEPSGV